MSDASLTTTLATTATVLKKNKPLPEKFSKFIRFGFYILKKYNEIDTLENNAASLIDEDLFFKRIALFDTVDIQTKLLTDFADNDKHIKKNIRELTKLHNKPPKKTRTRKTNNDTTSIQNENENENEKQNSKKPRKQKNVISVQDQLVNDLLSSALSTDIPIQTSSSSISHISPSNTDTNTDTDTDTVINIDTDIVVNIDNHNTLSNSELKRQRLLQKQSDKLEKNKLKEDEKLAKLKRKEDEKNAKLKLKEDKKKTNTKKNNTSTSTPTTDNNTIDNTTTIDNTPNSDISLPIDQDFEEEIELQSLTIDNISYGFDPLSLDVYDLSSSSIIGKFINHSLILS
jgi:hypothetical protein